MHSWHPVAVHLPLIAFVLAVLMDLLDKWRTGSGYRRAATLLWWLALAGAATAVATGLWAYGRVEHSDRAHQVMTLHRNLALGVIAALSVAALLRWRRPGSLLAALLGIGGVLGLGGVGFLGGELVFQHALGMETSRLQAIVRERGEDDMSALHDSTVGDGAPMSADSGSGTSVGHDSAGGDTHNHTHRHTQ